MGVLLECSIRAALIAAAVAAVVGGLRISGPRARHLAWCSVLVAMLLLPALTTWGPKATMRVLPAAAEPPAIAAWIAAEPLSAELPEPKAIDTRISPATRPAQGPSWTPNLALLSYLLVAGFLLIRLLMGSARAALLRSRAVQGNGFLISAECACPVTVGWRRPVVSFPLRGVSGRRRN
ncbi:MAG TPA: hypothetical protein PKJ41_20245 [Bryobacteraceae bacterium]|nr:hypothetical protein [Bryobacteraceae bacterium]HPT28429.1 hypothetical protein [Bryobacteraceae bacterium]